MKLDNIINHWDPLKIGKGMKVFILFSFYLTKTYLTLDLFNFRFNFSFGGD